MDRLILPAPAKLNRFLHVIGQRDDGYHLLQTGFHLLDFSDEVTLQRVENNKIIVESNLSTLNTPQNLALLAAKLLQQATQCRLGATIYLQKKIPLGGGLGGGSSNAATVLHGLNVLWDLKLSIAQLSDLGLQLGADVPLFIQGHSAWAEGIGEQLTPWVLPETWFFVLIPPVQIATVEIFCDKSLTRDTSACKISPSLIETGHNDCESVVRKRFPEVDAAMRWLDAEIGSASSARLTGTGSCIFAAFDQMEPALTLVEKTPEGMTSFVARGVNHSPLLAALRHCKTDAV